MYTGRNDGEGTAGQRLDKLEYQHPTCGQPAQRSRKRKIDTCYRFRENSMSVPVTNRTPKAGYPQPCTRA